MKVVQIAFCLALFIAPARADTISVTDAGAHVGKTVTVEGTVSGVYTARSGVTFIDMGGRYPNNLFAGVIFKDDAVKVGDVNGLTGKDVDITGTIQVYKSKPEIIIRARNQIKVP